MSEVHVGMNNTNGIFIALLQKLCYQESLLLFILQKTQNIEVKQGQLTEEDLKLSDELFKKALDFSMNKTKENALKILITIKQYFPEDELNEMLKELKIDRP